MEVVTIYNQKGGVGKTTTVAALTEILTAMGYKSLAVDMDDQMNLTRHTSIDCDVDVPSSAECLDGVCRLTDAIQKTPFGDVIPANGNLVGVATNLNAKPLVGFFTLQRLLQNPQNGIQDYDFIFPDSGPAMSVLSMNCLIAADSVIIPVMTNLHSNNGMSMLAANVRSLNEQIPNLQLGTKIDGAFINNYDEECAGDRIILRDFKKDVVEQEIPYYTAAIPHSRAVNTACSKMLPLLENKSGGVGVPSFIGLALEFLRRRGLEPRKEIPGIRRNPDTGAWEIPGSCYLTKEGVDHVRS